MVGCLAAEKTQEGERQKARTEISLLGPQRGGTVSTGSKVSKRVVVQVELSTWI